MKKSFLIAVYSFVLPALVFAQSEAERKIKQEVWNEASPEFKETNVPDKWRNESAVVLAYAQDYVGDFTTKVTGLTSVNRFYIEKITVHYRIKLLDKAAVQDFSEISFNNKIIRTNLFGKANSYRILGIKVIKPNGSAREVDLSEAVKSDAGSGKDLKIPIPDLETGDIIDYFVALRDERMAMPDFGDHEILEGKYPIVKQSLSFKLPHQLSFYGYPYHGAPDFKKEVIDKDVLYTLKDNMREKAPELHWTYDYQSAPHIRYTITNKEEKPDFKKTSEQLLKRFDYNISNIGFIVDFMSGNFKKEKDKRKIAEEIYYLLRNPIYMEAYFEIPQGEPLEYHYAPDLFFLLMRKALTKYNITSDIILVPARSYAPLEGLVNFNPCDVMIRVNTEPPLYIPRPSPFALPNEVPYIFEGVDGVSNPVSSSKNKMAVTAADQNATFSKLQVSVDDSDMSKLNIRRSVMATGHGKDYHQYLMFTHYDYLKEYDQAKYQVQSSSMLKGLIKTYNKEKVKFEQRLLQDYNDRDIRIKNALEREMDVKVSEYKNLSVKSIGMWHTASATEYSDEIAIENIAKKAGPNLILELGRLIEKQTEIKPDQRMRTRDVYMDYARSYNYEITFTIPEGYNVQGVENFNKKVENALGGFVSSASVDGKMLVIKTKKYYNKNHYTAAEWPQIVSYLDAAVDLYNQKVLLKKG